MILVILKFNGFIYRLAIQRLEIAKNDLRHRIAKEVVIGSFGGVLVH